ncbi:hypothetical protein [uncultured Enorma sp.]|uniref:hypothetical protein n=1 Tax=uncultured Enorma sp. TaxID=1714346 RepID=UPI0026119BD4|nr:hypothetical protein [uncultured Enorma sp.]
MATLLVAFGLLLPFGILAVLSSNMKKNAIQQQRDLEAERHRLEVAEQEKRKQEEHERNVISIYPDCLRRGITNCNSNESDILLIARNKMNDPDLSEENAKKLFNQSKNHYETERKIEWEKRQASLAEEEITEVRAAKAQAGYVGKMKYQQLLDSRITEYQKVVDAADQARQKEIEARIAIVRSAGIEPTPRSTVASAAINSALFGTAAGVAAANRTQARNESARRTYSSLQNNLRDMLYKKPIEESQEASIARGRLGILKHIEKDLSTKLCSEDDPEKYFGFLKVNAIELETTSSDKNLLATIEITPGYPQLFNSPAIIDGSLRLSIKSCDEIVAAGYYCAPFFSYGNKYVYLGYQGIYHLGFQAPLYKREKTREKESYTEKVIMRVKKGIDAATLLGSKVEIEPLHLWLLEN